MADFTVCDLKADLPTWPDDVLEQWFLPFANDPRGGWPPDFSRRTNRWSLWTGHRTLPLSKAICWKNSTISSDMGELTPACKSTLLKMIDCYFFFTKNEYSNIEDGFERLGRIRGYIDDFGTIPRPLICMASGNGIELMDGNHRACAILYASSIRQQSAGTGVAALRDEHEIWLGIPPPA